MSASSGNTASGAFERPERGEVLLSLTCSRSMVPLVGQIVRDILEAGAELARLIPEQDRLDRKRHTLSWPERSRRYQVQEDIAARERVRQQALAELENLGLVLIQPDTGCIGFPTIVNGRKAFFSWKPGEESLKYWHFAGEKVRRTIPVSWTKVDEVSTAV